MSWMLFQQVTALNKQTKSEKEDNKDMNVGKDKEVIDLSLDEEATNVSTEGIITVDVYIVICELMEYQTI